MAARLGRKANICLWVLIPLLGGLTPGPVNRRSVAQPAQAVGRVTAVSGPVVLSRLGGPARLLRPGDALFWGDVVEARNGGMSRIRLQDRVSLTVRPLSRLHIKEQSRPTGARYAFSLLCGRVHRSVFRALLRGADREAGQNAVASVRG